MSGWSKVRLSMLFLVVGCAVLMRCPESHGEGEAGAQFLRIPLGSKACGMGEAFVARADDPSAVYWNPAGLVRQQSTRVMATHVSWLEEMSYQYLSATRATGYGHFGLALSYSSSGDIPGRDDLFNETGDYKGCDAAMAVAYGRRLASHLSFGAGFKLIRQKIDREHATGWAVDAGALYDGLLLEGLSAGAAVHNIGPDIGFVEERDPLPLGFRCGLSYVRGPFTVSADAYRPRFSEVRVHIGGEVTLRELLALRAGYKSRPELDSTVTAGFGLFWRMMRIEYAYVPFEEINDTHYVSVTVQFGG